MPTRPFFFLFHLLLWGSTTAQPDAMPPEMVFVQGGTFEMGCTPEQTNCDSDESPVHEVTLTDFYIGKYEVTQAQWAAIVPEYSPNYDRGEGDTHPAYRISWYDAVTFCNRLSQQEGYTPAYYSDPGFTQVYDALDDGNGTVYWGPSANGYRLPTEAEWEYAARGGAQSGGYQFSGSDDINAVAWWDVNNDNSVLSQPAGTKAPNELGVYDMSGNVWEWCWDSYSSGYYAASPACAPLGPTGGSGRVQRGGSWLLSATFCRVAGRNIHNPWVRSNYVGFRLSRTP